MIGDTHRFRVKGLFVAGIILWAILLARLVQVQIVDQPTLAEAARYNHDCRQRIPARRGDILDRDLEPLARTVSGYAVKFVPSEAPGSGDVLPRLAELIRVDPQVLWRKADSGRPFMAARGILIDDDGAGVLSAMDGVHLTREQARVYPQGRNGAHIIGFVGVDNTGLEGTELQFESVLSGVPGWAVIARDGRGRGHSLPGEFFRPPDDGRRIVLTLDRDCQAIVERELQRGIEESGARWGVVVVMDPRNGDVVAMANAPGFDPNDPCESPQGDRRNRAITDFFEPGSTFKIVTLAAAVRHRVVQPDTVLNGDNGCARFDGYCIRDHDSYGEITFREAVEHSSNICFAKVALGIGRERLYQMARDFGVGCPTGIRLPGETGGILRAPREWSRRSLATISIGQEVAVSVLQLANLVAVVANGGTLMVPRIALGVRNSHGDWVARYDPVEIRRVLTVDEAAQVTDYLVGVVERGTGYRARIPGIPVAGKTGTAQKAENGAYVDGKYIASFVGYLPADDPAAVIVVVLDEPREKFYGGEVAAPVFRSIVERMTTTSGVCLGNDIIRWRINNDVRLASIDACPSSNGDAGGARH
ncbi:MAG: penicillin-binding protein 2 [Candidatus Eisenbacteria sp.]|nr:penicillin-binding protein 2 [Candidatus Eisenbacteria bacterium]